MAERIVSPGVFTQERDLSFLPQGVAQIGAAFVGPTAKGPAFIPTTVQGIDGFVTTFGEPDGISYTGYAAKNYLQEAGSAVVVRVLGLTGYTASVANIYATGSNGKKIFATLHPTTLGGNLTAVTSTLGGNTASFSLVLSSSGANTSASGLSVVEAATSFITKYFGTDPQAASTYSAYSYAVFPTATSQAGTGVFLVAETCSLNLNTVNGATSGAYSNASTPWIKSQTIGGTKHDLFKVHTLSDGTNTNKLIKISITGISPSTNPDSDFGTFSLLVRDFNDTDNSLNVLESFDNLTLDPDSANYVARRIGNSAPNYNEDTKETVYEGDFPNLSKYIRVEMKDAVIPDNAVPYGFAALKSTVSGSTTQLATGSYVTSRWVSASVSGYSLTAADKRYYYGYDVTDTTSLSYLGPIASENEVGSEFSIDNLGAEVPTTSAPFSRSIDLTGTNSRVDVGYRRFTVPLQGGYDGLNPARSIAMAENIVPSNTLGFDLSSATKSGAQAFKRAIDSLSNADSVDFNLLVVPGVIYSQHSYIAQAAIDICEQRGDCFYIVDLDTLNASIASVTAEAEELDTNYAAAYYPWVRILDSLTNKQMWAPASVVLPEVYAYSDSVGAEWFAPAGLNRGGIPGAIGVKTRLSQGNRDELYESKVNPIAQFPGQGITVWGQKTLQRRASALDRVNVRRLLITVKKFIASSARYLVFEQNTEATRNRFLNIVNPYLSGIQQRSGLTAFRVVMDETNNTPDVIDRNILQGAIYLQPTRTAEFIKLDFNILPTGATFDTI